MNESHFSLALATNIWTHHQAPGAMELAQRLGAEHFRMCLFEPVHPERQKLGWETQQPDYSWLVGPPDGPVGLSVLKEEILRADVAVLGAVPYEVQRLRAETGKLTFVMSERFLRSGFFRLRMLNPRYARGIRVLRSIANRPNVHFLTMGAYAAGDARRMGLFGDRIWEWGYFTPEAIGATAERPAGPVRILWAGRFLELKRVDLILRAAARLGSEVGDWTVELIGDGPMRQAVRKLAGRLGLAERVSFIDPLPAAEVRQRMKQAHLYVLPSNRQEGWGAVVNEAMSEGCVVLACAAAGSSRVLIEHGRTGFLFASGDERELAGLLKQTIGDARLRQEIGRAALLKMHAEWHPGVGAERLMELAAGLLGRGTIPTFVDGPCRNIGPG